jgi:phage shock protein PspC (stress-responsive transcriptional regulator)
MNETEILYANSRSKVEQSQEKRILGVCLTLAQTYTRTIQYLLRKREGRYMGFGFGEDVISIVHVLFILFVIIACACE